jgi:peptide/nickel transport system substrate-binding protein
MFWLKRFLKTFCFIVFLVLLLCPPTVPQVHAAKDTLVVAVASKFPSMNPYVTTNSTLNRMFYSLNGPPLYRDPKTNKYDPDRSLIISWKALDDVTWEFELRKGVKFHNGNALTAHDFKFTIEKAILDPTRKARMRTRYKMFKSVHVLDDHKFQITTKGPYALMLNRMASLRVFDEDTVKEKGWDFLLDNVVATGAYKMQKWIKGQSVTLVANEDYFMKGYPKTKKIVFRVIPEMSTRIAELRAGNVDLIFDVEPDKTKQVTNSPNLKIVGGAIPRLVFYQFDSIGRAAKSPVQDIRVRKAIWHAIDRETIVEKLLRGHGTVVNTAATPFLFGYDPTVKGLEYDPEKAKALLKEAGYEKGLELNLWQYSPVQGVFNRAAIDYLAKVGIKINLKDYRGNIGQLVKLRNKGKVTDIGNFGWSTGGVFDCAQILNLWFTKGNKKNYCKDEILEGWMAEASNTLDMPKRKELFQKAQHRIIEQVYWMPLFVKHELWGAHKDLEMNLPPWGSPRYYEMYWKK